MAFALLSYYKVVLSFGSYLEIHKSGVVFRDYDFLWAHLMIIFDKAHIDALKILQKRAHIHIKYIRLYVSIL